jgi:hypothetical protein
MTGVPEEEEGAPLDTLNEPIYGSPQYGIGRAQQFPTRKPFFRKGMELPVSDQSNHKDIDKKGNISWLYHIEYHAAS